MEDNHIRRFHGALMDLAVAAALLDAGIFARTDIELPQDVRDGWVEFIDSLRNRIDHERDELTHFGSHFDQ